MTDPDKLCQGRVMDAAPYGCGYGFAPVLSSNRRRLPHGGTHRSRPTNTNDLCLTAILCN